MKPNGLRKSPTYWLTNRKQIFGLAAACLPAYDGQSVSVHCCLLVTWHGTEEENNALGK